MDASLDRTHGRSLSRMLRSAALLMLASTIALAFTSSASAATVVPNASFEDTCGAATKACYWPDYSAPDFAAQRDPTRARSGTASYRLAVIPGSYFGLSLNSECIEIPLGAGTWTIGFSYLLAAGTNVNYVQYTVSTFSDPGCSGEYQQLQGSLTPTNDAEWHDFTATRTLSASAQSFWISLAYGCAVACPNTQVNFDDLLLEKEVPTAVRIASIRAAASEAGVVLSWRAAAASELLGFNVYRQRNAKLVKLNRTLIPSVFGATIGHRYSWLDRSAPNSGSVRYRLQAVSLSGKRSWIGATTLVGRSA